MGFQTSMNNDLPLGVEGDFVSNNPRQAYVTSEGALVAGAGGVTVGRFAWVTNNKTVSNTGTGVPSGFVHRHGQASITVWLDEASMVIQPGREVALMTTGDYLVKTLTNATVGQKVFAVLADGTIKTDAAGATVAGAVETNFKVLSAGAANEKIKIGTNWSN